MKLAVLAIFFYFVSTTMVESLFILGALVGFRIGYDLAKREDRRGYGRAYYGRGGRWGRSIEGSEDNSLQIQQVMLQASIQDNDDCAKAFVCQVNAKPIRTTPMEEFVYDYFGGNTRDTAMLRALMPGSAPGMTVVDVLSPSVQFELAAQVGRIGGVQTCQQIYAQCTLPYSELIAAIEGKVTPQTQPIEITYTPEQH
jgi:hypothetical protein